MKPERAGQVRLRSGQSSRPCPLTTSWQSRRAQRRACVNRRRRTASHLPFPESVVVAGSALLSRSCRGASPPAHGSPCGRDPGPIQGTTRASRRSIKGSLQWGPGDSRPSELRTSARPGPQASVQGSGHDQSGRSEHGGQQSERHRLTRRCSGLASLAAELHSLGPVSNVQASWSGRFGRRLLAVR